MSATRKMVLLVAMGAGACLLSFLLSQYFARKTHADQLLLTQVQSLAPRVEHIRLLSKNFLRNGDEIKWREIVANLKLLDVDIASESHAGQKWQAELEGLELRFSAYRRLLNRIHDPALAFNAEKVDLQGIGLSFAKEVETHIIAPYRDEAGLRLYAGHQIDPFKNRIKDTAYEVMRLHLQQQLILLELMADGDMAAYQRQKTIIARAMAQHKTQLNYMGVLVGDDPQFDTVIASLQQKMDRLINHEKIIIGHFMALTALNGELVATGEDLLRASEALTAKIVAAISSANQLNQGLSWGLFVVILVGLGLVGVLLARDLLCFVNAIEESREALRESEERLDLALAGANEGIWDWNLVTGKMLFDDRYYTLSGYAPNAFPAAYEEWEKRVHPEDVDAAKMAIKRYLDGETDVYSVEFRFLCENGDYMWIQGRGKVVARDTRGAPIRFIGTHADISARKRLEESLRLTQFSFDKAPIGIWRMGAIGEVLDVNEQGCRSLGYSRETLCRMTVFDFAPDFGTADWTRFMTQLHEVGTTTIEALNRRKNGEVFPIQVTSNLLRFEGREYHLAFVQDITERKRDEAALRRLRNYLSNIIDSMPSILVAVDVDGRVTLWNRWAAQATGLRAETVLSQPVGDVFPRLASEMGCIKDSIRERRVIRSPKAVRDSADGSRFEEITVFPLVSNGVEGAVIRVDDVTERVRLEEMMIQSEKMLSVGGLAAGMAHEINNPLAGILQSVSILENRLLGDLPANRKAAERAGITPDGLSAYLTSRKLPGMIENIREAGTRAADIVRNMLSFTRKSDRVVSHQDIGSLLDRTIELVHTDYDMKKSYDFKQIHIERAYDPSVPPVPCVASKIQQVFMNILKNGAEAMAEATDAPDPPAFVLRVQDDGDWVRVEIEDNGPGMDEATRRRIFEPFYTTKPVGQGTGLGLSVSYFIITEDHDGEMSVRMADGGGTCFVIRLPKKGGCMK